MIDERLEQAVIKTGAKLLILDPIQAYLGSGICFCQFPNQTLRLFHFICFRGNAA